MFEAKLLIAAALAVLFFVAFVWAGISLLIMKFRAQKVVQDAVERWKDRELERLEHQYGKIAEKTAENMFREWQAEEIKNVRADAIQKSKAVTGGKVSEHFVPFLDDFPFHPSDARFLGSPIDYMVFDGMSDGLEDLTIAFVEVKTGKSGLTKRERRIRDAVKARRVKWVEVRLAKRAFDRGDER